MNKTDKSVLWYANKARGSNAEALFSCHAEEITGVAVCGKLEQAAHEEGDFLMQDGTIIEVKADANGSYLQTGNVCIQIANDAGTGVGSLQDMLSSSSRHVDKITFMLCGDFACKRAYAAVTMPVEKLGSLCGCPAGGCAACGRCRPGRAGWQKRAFPHARLTKDGRCILLPLDGILQADDVRVTILRNLERLPPLERVRYSKLIKVRKN
ncbi:MAG: hypothetical protein ACI4O4_12090 [Candidatus Ventricola sp.]